MSKPRCLLDASAVLAFLRNEKGAATVERLLPVAAISAVNLTEVVLTVTGQRGPEGTTRCLDDLTGVGLTVLDYRLSPEDLIAVRAADPDRALSLGDACCLAAGRARGLPVITDDTAWPPIAAAVGVVTHLFR